MSRLMVLILTTVTSRNDPQRIVDVVDSTSYGSPAPFFLALLYFSFGFKICFTMELLGIEGN